MAVYLLVAYAGTALIAALLVLSGLSEGVAGVALTALAMFAPLLATLAAQRAAGEPLLSGLGARPAFNRWLLVASGLGLLLPLAGTLGSRALPGTTLDLSGLAILERYGDAMTAAQRAEAEAQLRALPPGWVLLTIPQAALAGLSVNALFAFGEEIGWRGWLLRRVSAWGFWRANLFIGAIWGLWHAPLILLGHNYPVHRIEGVFLFTLVCILLSPLHALVRERGGSVWHAAVLHGTMNAGAGLSVLFVRGGDDLTVGLPGLGGVLGLLAVNLALLPWTLRLQLTGPDAAGPPGAGSPPHSPPPTPPPR